MGFINIKGKPTNISLEEARAMIFACDAVLSFHKKKPLIHLVTIKFKTKKSFGPDELGCAFYKQVEAWICKDLDFNNMLTVILHEMIHLYINSETLEGSEHITSTLTSKLKKTVLSLANTLVKNTYKNAAYFAHAKISYRRDNDSYNGDQYKKIGKSKGEKYRKLT